MSMLAQVTRGKIRRPHAIVLYGLDGAGKTSTAAEMPGVIFLATERGTDQLEVARFPTPKRWFDVEQCVQELLTQPHDYKTLAIDSVDWLEALLNARVSEANGVKTIEDIPYGRGPGFAIVEWRKFLGQLDELREKKKMNIVAIGHAELERFTDVSNDYQEYSRYGIKLQKKAAALWREWADAVLFQHFLVHKTTDAKDKKTRIKGGDTRVINTERRAGWDAKNRYGLPPQIILSENAWADLSKAIERGLGETPAEIKTRIAQYLGEMDPSEQKEKIEAAVSKAGDDMKTLRAYALRLSEILDEQKEGPKE